MYKLGPRYILVHTAYQNQIYIIKIGYRMLYVWMEECMFYVFAKCNLMAYLKRAYLKQRHVSVKIKKIINIFINMIEILDFVSTQ